MKVLDTRVEPMNQGVPLENCDAAAEEASGTESDSQLTFSIVIPTYNEEESIETTLDAIYAASPIPPSSFEIIVADESDDETPSIVRNLEYPNLRLLRFDERKGLAGSVIEGFNVSNGTYVGVIDADGQHPPETLFKLLEEANGGDHDIVVASRYIEGGGIENWSWFSLGGCHRHCPAIAASWCRHPGPALGLFCCSSVPHCGSDA